MRQITLTLSGALGDTSVPFIAYVINLPCAFAHYLELSGFQFYFMIWIVVFYNFNHLSPLVYFVSAAGCHCFDLVFNHINMKMKSFFEIS